MEQGRPVGPYEVLAHFIWHLEDRSACTVGFASLLCVKCELRRHHITTSLETFALVGACNLLTGMHKLAMGK